MAADAAGVTILLYLRAKCQDAMQDPHTMMRICNFNLGHGQFNMVGRKSAPRSRSEASTKKQSSNRRDPP